MIKGYNEHAANERTFLAWVRTGLATIAFWRSAERASAGGLATRPRERALEQR
jgi:uncharacterized membrane protein YidH (DUF202 family)